MCLPPRDASTFAADFHQRAHDVMETRTHLARRAERTCVTRASVATTRTRALRGVERNARPRTPRLIGEIAIVSRDLLDERFEIAEKQHDHLILNIDRLPFASLS